MLKLNGIFPPVPTSFESNEDLAFDKLKDNILKLSQFDLSGFLVLGSNGENVMLSQTEKVQVFAAARSAIPKDKLMLAGTGEQSTKATVSLTKAAAEAGAEAALVLNPSYFKGLMTKQALVKHYRQVADSSPIPIIVYNMPACSGLDLNAETVADISQHPNVIGMKDSGGNISKMANIVRTASPGFQLLAGSASFLLPALTIGAVGGILATANIAPTLCLDLYHSFLGGDLDNARAVQSDVLPINQAVTSEGGVPALKEAMDFLGLYGGPARNPILPLDKPAKDKLHKILIDNKITL